MKDLLVVICFGSILFGCTKDENVLDCSTVLPPPNWFEISIDDPSGNQLINNVFIQDSFVFYSILEQSYLKPLEFAGDPSYLMVAFPDVEEGVEYYIELSTTDTDTIVFNYTEKINSCYSDYNLFEILYNGESTLIAGDGRRYHLVKY